METSPLGRVGFVGRFKPLHNGGYSLLESACKNSDHVLIGIGSCNKYNLRNPFTAEESEEMIRRTLSPVYSNFEISYVPDFAQVPEFSDGKEWKKYIVDKFGKLDYFISGNDFVRELLADSYPLLQPYEIIPEERKVRLKSTEVRIEMARFGDWESLVPKPVEEYLKQNGIVERFRSEFGIKTLAGIFDENILKEDARIEKIRAREL